MLHQMAKEYGQTPAAQMQIDDPLMAFCINRACYWAGNHWKELSALKM